MFNNRFKTSNATAPPFSVCWGKTERGYPSVSVVTHSITVGLVFKTLLNKLPPCKRQYFPKGSVTLAACHDAGKITPGFQKKSTPWVEGIIPSLAQQDYYLKYHAQVSYDALMHRTGNQDQAKIVGSHHGMFSGHRQKHAYRGDKNGGDAWSIERQRFMDDMLDRFGPLPEHSKPFTYPELINVGGLLTVSDWVGSNTNLFNSTNSVDENHIMTAVKDLGFYFPKVVENLSFRGMFPFPPNSIQQQVIENYRGKGLYVIEAETGSGKTEAALYLAYKLIEEGLNSGIYFALPTQVTANRMFPRLRSFVAKIYKQGGKGINPQLIHGNSWLENDSFSGLNIPYSWFSPNKRSLLADVGVGTIDQALLSIMGSYHSFVRLFGLAGKVVIIDEIHSYDDYTGTLNTELINRLLELGSTVIVLSATLTKKQRTDLMGMSGDFISVNDYPLISYSNTEVVEEISVPPNKDLDITLDLCILPSNSQDLLPSNKKYFLEREARELYNKAKEGAKILCIKNTVPKAQTLYRYLEEIMEEEDGIELGLLHAYYPITKRVENEAYWMDKLGKDVTKRPLKGCILISTQIAEQSVDLDMDYIYTDLAPMAVLLQRCGRLWRFPIEDRTVHKPIIKVVTYNLFVAKSVKALRILLGGDAYIYHMYDLYRTFLVLLNVKTINVPGDVRSLLEQSYNENFVNEGILKDLYLDLKKLKSNFKNVALSHVSDGFETGDTQGIATRMSQVVYYKILMVKDYKKTETTIDMTLFEGTKVTIDLKERYKDRGVAKALLSTAVKIINSYIEDFPSCEAPDAISRFFYTKVYICILDENKLLTLDYEDTNLKYFDNLGLQYKDLA